MANNKNMEDKKHKLIEFLKGVGVIVAVLIVGILLGSSDSITQHISSDFLVIELPFAVGILGAIYMFIKKRRYFALGLIVAPVLLLIIATLVIETVCSPVCL